MRRSAYFAKGRLGWELEMDLRSSSKEQSTHRKKLRSDEKSPQSVANQIGIKSQDNASEGIILDLTEYDQMLKVEFKRFRYGVLKCISARGPRMLQLPVLMIVIICDMIGR
jgi:hypothetical protein